MNVKILNRQVAASDALPEWYQIEVSGEHPAGKGRMQVIDATARAAIVADFNARSSTEGPTLIDNDHLSHDLRNSTEAFGWLGELREVNGQIEGRIEWTDIGEAAIRNKRFRFFSTEYPAEGLELVEEGKVRPRSLEGLAVTNRPNNKGGKPILNRDDDPDDSTKKTKHDMKAIANKLGLEDGADEAAILAAIGALSAKKTEAEDGIKNRDSQLEVFREKEAEALIEKYGERIGENAELRHHFKTEAIKNREATEKLLAALPEKTAEKPAPIHNRAGAKTPLPVEGGEGGQEAPSMAIFNRAKELQSREKMPWNQAWQRASSENLKG